MPKIDQLLAMHRVASAFLVVAKETHAYIEREGIDDVRCETYRGSNNLTPQNIWIAMRSALDYNMHQAFELFIKLLLKVEGTKYGRDHKLASLFAKLKRTSRNDLDKIRKKHFMNSFRGGKSMEFVAFMMAEKEPPLPPSKDSDFNSFEGILTYFDEELALYQRRYSHEAIEKGQWLEFVRDVRPLFTLLDEVSGYCGRRLSFSSPSR